MRQYHPLFAHFLRKSLGEQYEVLTNFAVGDLPREADVVVLKRTALRGRQLRHLWRWLTTWNVLEFKAPTVSPRESHLDLLLELGLGVARRLNEQRAHDNLRPLSYQQISWWYVVRKLSERLRGKWEQRLGGLEEVERGVWRGAVAGYPLYLVSSIETPLDAETLPLHVLAARESQERVTLAQYVLGHPDAYRQYAAWMYALHTKVWKKERSMAGKVIDDNLEIDWKLLAEEFGLDGLANLIEQAGLARVVEEVGLARVVEEVGLARVVEEVGIDKLLEGLSSEQRTQLRQRL